MVMGAIGGMLGSSLGSSLGGGIAGALSAGLGGALSAGEAKKQRKWQEKMRATAYQATMEDMRKAGLNPILAYKQGATSAGSGAAARFPDVGQAFASGAQAGSATFIRKKQGELVAQQTRTSASQGVQAEALAEKARMEAIHQGLMNERATILNNTYRTEAGQRILLRKDAGAISAGAAEVERWLPELKRTWENFGPPMVREHYKKNPPNWRLPNWRLDRWRK